MQTNPAVEQNKNIRWSKSPWNQSGAYNKIVLDFGYLAPLWNEGSGVENWGKCVLFDPL